MFNAHTSGNHISMIESKSLGPNILRSKVAPVEAIPNAAQVSSVSRMCRWCANVSAQSSAGCIVA
jgi:hypothetical protein